MLQYLGLELFSYYSALAIDCLIPQLYNLDSMSVGHADTVQPVDKDAIVK